MLLKGFKAFWQNARRQKTVALFSLCNLAVAIGVVILVGLWAFNEFTFDRFHKDKERIYGVTGTLKMNDAWMTIGSTYKILGADALEHCPEVEAMCRIRPKTYEVKTDVESFGQHTVFLADTNFFTFFSFKVKAGDSWNCLMSPDRIVIDDYMAERCFPGENPLGKEVRVGDLIFTVSAVMETMPANSHLKTHWVVPFFGPYLPDFNYGETDAYITYLKVNASFVKSELEDKLTRLIRNSEEAFEQLKFEYKLEDLSSIHFNTSFIFSNGVDHGDKAIVYLFMLTALIILCIACVNFINLFISTSFLRAKSIGVKKSFGENNGEMVREFYGETFYYALLSAVAGLGLAVFIQPFFNELTGSFFSIDFTDWKLYLFLAIVVLLVMWMAGSFPAFYLTRFNVVSTLTGHFKGRQMSFLQKGLIVMQFTVSILILLVVFFIHKQVDYMVHKDLGFNKENVMYVRDKGGFTKKYEAFVAEMKKYPGILDVTLSGSLLVNWENGNVVRKSDQQEGLLMEICQVKPNYFQFMQMKLVDGEELDPLYSRGECILNEAAAKNLGITKVGEKAIMNGNYFTVKGIVADVQTKSLHRKVDPQFYYVPKEWDGGVVYFRLAGDPREAICRIEEQWKNLNPDIPFNYEFLDTTYAYMYKAETNLTRILEIAMSITLVMSVAGLYAMAHYMMQRRQKEIGIRKVNGARVMDLLVLLNSRFLVWVGIAFLLACPLAYWFLSHWQENYTVRIALNGWIFAAVGLLMLMVVLCTVSFQTWKAANVNPVKVLKRE